MLVLSLQINSDAQWQQVIDVTYVMSYNALCFVFFLICTTSGQVFTDKQEMQILSHTLFF